MKTNYHKQTIGFCLFIMIALTACKENKLNIIDITEPAWEAQLTITEAKKSDGGNVTYKEVYDYADMLILKSHYTQQSVLGTEISNVYNISNDFSAKKDIFTDELGNTWEFQIKDGNRLLNCKYYTTGGEERTYQYKYYGDNLEQLDEYIDNKLYATAIFDYIDDYNTKLTTTINGHTEVLLIKYSDEIQRNVIPNYFLLEIYPLSTQRLGYYNGYFGVNHRVIKQMQYEGSDEITTFTYNNDLHITCVVPDFCTQTITGEDYSMTRTVTYTLTNDVLF